MAVLKTTSPDRSAGAPKLLPSKTVPSSKARIADSNMISSWECVTPILAGEAGAGAGGGGRGVWGCRVLKRALRGGGERGCGWGGGGAWRVLDFCLSSRGGVPVVG